VFDKDGILKHIISQTEKWWLGYCR